MQNAFNISPRVSKGLKITLFRNTSPRAGGVAQVVKHLPSKYKALSSNANTTKTGPKSPKTSETQGKFLAMSP
jgi:hypothetical protein